MEIHNILLKLLGLLVTGFVILSTVHGSAQAQNRGLQADDTNEDQLFAHPRAVRN